MCPPETRQHATSDDARPAAERPRAGRGGNAVGSSADPLQDEVLDAYADRRFDDSHVLSLLLVKREPTLCWAWMIMVDSLLTLGRTATAAAQAATAVGMEPDEPELNYLHGRALAALGRTVEAIDALRACVRLNPAHTAARGLLMAVSSAAFGAIPGTDDRASGADPQPHQDQLRRIRLAREHHGQGPSVTTADEYKAAIALEPAFSEAYEGLAAIRREEKANRDAMALYRRAIHLYPMNSHGHYQIGLLFMKRNAIERAKEEFVSALRIRPNTASHYFMVGYCCLVLHQEAEGYALCHRGEALSPRHPGRSLIQSFRNKNIAPEYDWFFDE